MIRLFIGASRVQAVPALVLYSSAAERSSLPIEPFFLWDCKVPIPLPRDKANRPRTPFSFQRFAIPEICGYEGRAIYLDSDMIVLDNLADLWTMDMEGMPVLATDVNPSARNAVMLIDCERALWDIPAIVRRLDDGEVTYKGLMEDLDRLGPVARTIPKQWNRLDDYTPPVSILHYTDMRRQPWLATGHPLEHMWLKEAQGAHSTDFADELCSAETNGHVRAGLTDAILEFKEHLSIADLYPKKLSVALAPEDLAAFATRCKNDGVYGQGILRTLVHLYVKGEIKPLRTPPPPKPYKAWVTLLAAEDLYEKFKGRAKAEDRLAGAALRGLAVLFGKKGDPIMDRPYLLNSARLEPGRGGRGIRGRKFPKMRKRIS